MKRAVVQFGVLSGLASAGLMVVTIQFADRIGFERGAIVGYAGMVAAFLFVYFGIRSYRDKALGGAITFGRALATGLMMMVISCAFYAAAWEFIYFKITPDFMTKYATYALDRQRAAGATDAQLAATARQMADFKTMYDKPLYNAAVTFMEPLPVGLLMTVISAGILRRKRP